MNHTTKPDLSGWTVAFIGLGLMGRPMALNLHEAGATVIAYTRTRAKLDALAAHGLTPADSAADAASRADIVILMLPDTATVEDVLLGESGVLEGLKPSTIVMDMGTTEARATRDFAERVQGQGGDYVDAPVSGGTIGAEDGTLVVMAGGTDDAFARVRPVLNVLGKSAVHVGPVGAGQVAKAANQVIVGLTISAVGEALSLAKRAGADPARVREALMGGFAASRILEVHGQRMIDGDFTPGGKCVTQRKDLYQALRLAEESGGLRLPTTELVMELYDRVIDAGYGDEDHAALVRVLSLVASDRP